MGDWSLVGAQLYAPLTFSVLLYLFLLSKLFDFILRRYSKNYLDLSLTLRRAVVNYAVGLLASIMALGFDLASLGSPESNLARNEVMIGAGLITSMIVFELTFRPTMRSSTLIHHICAFCAIIALVGINVYTGLAAFADGLLRLYLITVTTNQVVLIAMISYRLGYPIPTTQSLFRIAAVQTFLVNTAAVIYLVLTWGAKLVQTPSPGGAVIVVVLAMLMLSYIYGAFRLWSIVNYLECLPRIPMMPPGDADEDMETESMLMAENGGVLDLEERSHDNRKERQHAYLGGKMYRTVTRSQFPSGL